MLKIVFFGTPSFVNPIVKSLRDNFELLKEVRNPKGLNEEEIKKLNADIFVVASFGKIFTKEFINLPKYGSINIHPSKLPKYRGSSPIQTQIIDGVKESAVTFIKMDEQVDHGPIIASTPFEILDSDTFEIAAHRAFQIAADNLPDLIKNYVEGRIKPIEQDHSKTLYTEHLEKEDGYIDIDNPPSSEKLDRMIRAFYPWPGVWTKFNNKIVKFLPEEKIQVEGRKLMSYKDFVNGYKEGKEFLKSLNLLG